jgi:hypothetical protein
MNPLETSWTDAEGRDHTVTTHRAPGESNTAWHARHDEAVAAAKAKWPPA